MCIRYLGFVLLIWCPPVLRAQSATQSCAAPVLYGGLFSPKQETYSHGAKLTYTCDNGRKPAVKGWWATITCQDGRWSPEPQCIDEQACIPPTIPNAQYTENLHGWYEEGDKIRITCDNGYEPNDGRRVITTCVNGTWSPVPVCERSIYACGEPPQIPHAVIVQEYQELFAADSEVKYECEDGYTVEGEDSNKLIICIAGNWTEGPTCSRGAGPDSGRGGGTSGDKTQTTGGGSSATSSGDGRDRPSFTRIDHCGEQPFVPNGVVVQTEQHFLKYKCVAYHKLVGSDTVTCYSDGTWSQAPVCQEAFCVLTPGQYLRNSVRVTTTEYIDDGKIKEIPCVWHYYTTLARCANGKITFSRCCLSYDRRSCY